MIRRRADTFSYSEARRAGVSASRIYRLRDTGVIIALGGGAYRWADAPPANDDLIEIAERVPAATICLESALACTTAPSTASPTPMPGPARSLRPDGQMCGKCADGRTFAAHFTLSPVRYEPDRPTTTATAQNAEDVRASMRPEPRFKVA